jgi:FkbM family methyltransferase
MAMILDVDGLQINLIDDEDRQVLHVKRGDGYEEASLVAWSKMVVPDLVALDIGAYTGLFSIIAAKRGAVAVALEPMPANRWRLDCNAKQNKVLVRVMPCAASDAPGVTTLHYNSKVPLTTGASLEKGAMHNASISITRCTVDALALPRVGAIKIDVEKHEHCVIRGAMQTINRDRPSLLIEVLDADAFRTVRDMLPNYECKVVYDGRNALFTPIGGNHAARTDSRHGVSESGRTDVSAQGKPDGLVLSC